MSEIVLNAELAAKIRAAGPDVRFVAEDGTEIGRAEIKLSDDDDFNFSEEEFQDRISGPTSSLSEILHEFREKYGS